MNALRKFEPIYILWAAVIAFVAAAILIPLAYLLAASITGESGILGHYVRTLSAPGTVRAAVNTLIYVGGVSALSVIIGVPLAFLVERVNIAPWAAKLLRLSIIATVVTPGFLMAMAYVNLLGPNAGVINVWLRDLLGLGASKGPINIFSLPGVLLLGTQSAVAFVFLVTSASLAKMNPEFEEASEISGAGRLRTITRITLPLVRNAIYAGALVSLAGALTDYGVPHMLGYTVLTLRIREYMLGGDFAGAAAVSMLLVGFSIFVLALYRRSIRGNNFAIVGGKGYQPKKIDIGAWRWAFNAFAVIYVCVTIIVPVAGLVMVSFLRSLGRGFSVDNLTTRHYYNILFRDDLAFRSFINSMLLSISTAVVASLLALVIAYLIVRRRNILTSALDYLSVLPTGIAGTALAVAIILTVTNAPFATLSLYGTLWVLFIAYFIRNFPLAVRPIQTTIMQLSPELEEAARLAGASWLHSTRTIIVPLILPGILAGAVLVFLASLTEVSASIILRHIGTDTVSTAILDIWDSGGGYQQASAFAVCIFVTMVAIALLAQLAQRKSKLTDQDFGR